MSILIIPPETTLINLDGFRSVIVDKRDKGKWYVVIQYADGTTEWIDATTRMAKANALHDRILDALRHANQIDSLLIDLSIREEPTE